MTKTLQDRLIYFFIFILLMSFAGFYKTYLIKFPDFDGFTSAHHFHGAVMLIWIFMLIAQPIFIRTKNLEWHRIVGKASYIIFPLLVLSFFLVARAGYLRNIKTIAEADALAGMTNGIPDMIFISILYGLGIYYKKKTSFHLRFFASIGLMILGPGLGRFLIVFCNLPFQVAIPLLIGLTSGVALIWMIIDIRNKKSFFPMATFLSIGFLAMFLGVNNHSTWWQSFAKWFAGTFF
jgi:hypothetical protein